MNLFLFLCVSFLHSSIAYQENPQNLLDVSKDEGKVVVDFLQSLSSDKIQRANVVAKCPVLSEYALPDFSQLSHYVCYVVLDCVWMLETYDFPVFKNWQNAKALKLGTLDLAINAWDADALLDFPTSLGDLSLPNQATFKKLIQRLIIARYVKSSVEMNDYLWADDRVTSARGICGREPLCLIYPTALRKWAVLALEKSLEDQPRANGDTIFRGKTLRAASRVEALDFYRVNNLVWGPAFQSNSLDQQIALGYTNVNSPINVLVETILANPTEGATLNTAAREVLIPPGVVFKITDVNVHDNFVGDFVGTNFVDNGCPARTVCQATWPTLIHVVMQEVPAGTAVLVAAQTAIENACGADNFVKQCGAEAHQAITSKPLTKLGGRIYRQVVGATSGSCTHLNQDYTCKTKSVSGGCYACVLCESPTNVITATSLRFAANPFQCNRGVHAEGAWFIDPAV